MELLLVLAVLAGLITLPFVAFNLVLNLLLYFWRALAPVTRFAQEQQVKWLRPELYMTSFLAIVVILCTLGPNFSPHEGYKVKNSGVHANVYKIQLALEQYAKEHEGTYPSSLGELFPSYLSGYPPTPWNTQQAPSADIPAVVTQVPFSLTQSLGKGQVEDPRRPTDFGAVGYARLDPDGRHYFLTGTGRRQDDDAVIVFATSDFYPQPSPNMRPGQASPPVGRDSNRQRPTRGSKR